MPSLTWQPSTPKSWELPLQCPVQADCRKPLMPFPNDLSMSPLPNNMPSPLPPELPKRVKNHLWLFTVPFYNAPTINSFTISPFKNCPLRYVSIEQGWLAKTDPPITAYSTLPSFSLYPISKYGRPLTKTNSFTP